MTKDVVIDHPIICLLIGPGGAGKTTVSALLAKKFSKCVVIEADELRHMVKKGLTDPFSREGQDQLVLSTKNSCLLAKSFADQNFNVIIDDCVAGKPRLDLYYKLLKRYHLVTILLLPNREAIRHRDSRRTGTARLGKKTLAIHDKFIQRIEQEKRWHVIDNSNHTPQTTMRAIYKLLR